MQRPLLFPNPSPHSYGSLDEMPDLELPPSVWSPPEPEIKRTERTRQISHLISKIIPPIACLVVIAVLWVFYSEWGNDFQKKIESP